MAKFIPSKKEATDFNNGVAYMAGDAVRANDMNNLVEGLLSAQENAGGGTSGLFEIPYNLTDLQSNSDGVDFIINNINKIKKGAYFVHSGASVLIEQVEEFGNYILLIFDEGSFSFSDSHLRWTINIEKTRKMVSSAIDNIDMSDAGQAPQIMVCRSYDDTTRIYSAYSLSANEENEGKVVGVQDGQFAMVDVGSSGSPLHTYVIAIPLDRVGLSPAGSYITLQFTSPVNYNNGAPYNALIDALNGIPLPVSGGRLNDMRDKYIPYSYALFDDGDLVCYYAKEEAGFELEEDAFGSVEQFLYQIN